MSIDGDWKVTVQTPMGSQEQTFTVTTDGDTISGMVKSAMGDMEIKEGKIDGNNLSWKMDMTVPMPMTLDVTATVDGDKISGQAVSSFGPAPFEGEKVS